MQSAALIDTIDESIVMPYFQPIISLQNRRIIGYEALGRQLVGGKAVSLGPLFQSTDIPDEKLLQLDRMLRIKALARAATCQDDCMFFLNLRPSWIYDNFLETGRNATIRYIEEFGLDPQRVVIEITEDSTRASAQELADVVMNYRNFGCKIAIDDVGSGFSHFDRIALINPDIVKVDFKLLRRSESHQGYYALLRAHANLAEQIGASLLIEGVEDERDLLHALSVGARYVQGFLFSPAVPKFLKPDVFEDMLRRQMSIFADEQLAKYQELYSVNRWFLSHVLPARPFCESDDADAYIRSFLDQVPTRCFRIYLCMEDGTQISSNFTRNDAGIWIQDPSIRGANWIWRPYFIPNIVRMQTGSAPTFSQTYTDLETLQTIHTYSASVGNGYYLFFDLTV